MIREPFPDWTQPNRILGQDLGLPAFLGPSDLTWIDWAKRRLGSFSWPSSTQTPPLGPFHGRPVPAPGSRLERQLSGGVSEIRPGKDCWRLDLDLDHFSPEEIAITTKMGYLEISGGYLSPGNGEPAPEQPANTHLVLSPRSVKPEEWNTGMMILRDRKIICQGIKDSAGPFLEVQTQTLILNTLRCH
ncbi:hypothetical protein NHX12_027588 [Muraenolepis orangiensis]|uniref:Uncharacterized protein n=1 Tax=Muraenolepis orangiensis TaxID=630683 RepID=A0A9Q0EFS9_9TELE|nr:hypothetical protein NHX12_027588 [Muraenolepis orangiensis]